MYRFWDELARPEMLLQIWSTTHFKPLDEGKANSTLLFATGSKSWWLPEHSIGATSYRADDPNADNYTPLVAGSQMNL